MVSDVPLAHSSRDGVPPQTYVDHVENVSYKAICNAQEATAFYKGDRARFISCVEAAAMYHDLGKLDKANQAVLKEGLRKPLPIAHDDAGVAELDNLGHKEAAVLAYGHHDGLFSRSEELAKQGRPFRQLKKKTPDGEKVADHVDHALKDYEMLHSDAGCSKLIRVDPSPLHACGFTRRIALSCLVDADHGDTARHYGNEVKTQDVQQRWSERLTALERYVSGLPKGKTEREEARNRLRKQMFEACRDSALYPPIRTCDAPVGSGKTTAVMANLLRVAAERKPQLRHIIVVLPYTNIITQSVETYRKALVLDGERAEDVVAEHHHRADFADLDLRQLATLWKAPIIVTTAVQFFETLGSHHPAQLRKLHELPGSAVFIDEMHAAIPSHLWPQMWRWLETWTREWGGYLVLASGSLSRFWELDEYKSLIWHNDPAHVPEVLDLVTDNSLRSDLKKIEEKRISYRRRPENTHALDCHGIVDFVVRKEPGPRLLIVNTVQTAAVIAQAMRRMGHDVIHLSTALAPAHRVLIVERVKQRLKYKVEDWTLVATSCIEAGLNFSFRTGFRERFSTASLIQVGGRVSRGDEFHDAEVWDILLRDDQFRSNPSVETLRRALDSFTVEELNNIHPSELATAAMKREWTSGAEAKARQLIEDENNMEYPSVADESRVITADTRTVLVDKFLIAAMNKGGRVPKYELMKYSVQIWASKIDELALKPLNQNRQSDEMGIYSWNYEYDPDFLGYMAGVLKLEKFIAAGGAVI